MRPPLANSFFVYVAKRVFAQLGLLVSRFAISAAITHTFALLEISYRNGPSAETDTTIIQLRPLCSIQYGRPYSVIAITMHPSCAVRAEHLWKSTAEVWVMIIIFSLGQHRDPQAPCIDSPATGAAFRTHPTI